MIAEQTPRLLQAFEEFLNFPAWTHIDFWIGIAALFFAFLAFIEAKQAKRAARAAGKIVKMQSVISDLTEISTSLDRLHPDIEFTEARDFINHVSRRIRRLIAPFGNDADLVASIAILRDSLTSLNNSLNSALPTDDPNAQLPPRAYLYAVQSSMADVNGFVADVLRRNGKQIHTHRGTQETQVVAEPPGDLHEPMGSNPIEHTKPPMSPLEQEIDRIIADTEDPAR